MTKHHFTLIDKAENAVNASWNGAPTTLLTNQNTVMPQTPNGTVVLTLLNQTSGNNQGQIALTSGGAIPQFITVDAHANQPTAKTANWQANNLSLTNVSANNDTPILVQAVGPGIPGITPLALTIGTPLLLSYGQVAQGNSSPQWVQLVVQVTGPTLGILALIGGPPDATGNNGYLIAVNASANTGPGSTPPPPPGYYATTTSNTYTFPFNWGSSLVFVANMSPSTAQSVSVLLRAL